jgi:hypothetical protein
MIGNVTEGAALGRDLGYIIGAVHQVVEVGHTAGGHRRQRDRNLAVVQRSGGQHGADRQIAIGYIEMQLVADPADRMALGVATAMLIERLAVDKQLRRLCGWEHPGELPSEATFSRAFAEFARSALPGRLHEALIKRSYEDRAGSCIWWICGFRWGNDSRRLSQPGRSQTTGHVGARWLGSVTGDAARQRLGASRRRLGLPGGRGGVIVERRPIRGWHKLLESNVALRA